MNCIILWFSVLQELYMEKNSRELHEIIVTAEIKIKIASKNIFKKYLFFSELSEHMEWGMKFHNFWCVMSELL